MLGDHLNTVRDVVKSDGSVAKHLEYNAFGECLSVNTSFPRRRESSQNDNELAFLYTGKLFDAKTGLQWNINRWYDPKVGRWASEDPIGFLAGDTNLFRYVFANSISFLDAFGFSADSVSQAIKNAILTRNLQLLKDLLGNGGSLSLAQTEAALLAIATIELLNRIDANKKSGCKPCDPPAGTMGYRVDLVPPSKCHYPFKGTHTHHRQMTQSPHPVCKCFWGPETITDGSSPGLLEKSISPAQGGGVL